MRDERGLDEPALDGNLRRVLARLFAVRGDARSAAVQEQLWAHARALLPRGRAGDFAQAMMDLGATICTPRRPRCMLCPLREDCSAIVNSDPELYPVKPPKTEKPMRRGAAFVAVTPDGSVLLRKRPGKGLLGGMTEVPTTGWTSRIDGATGADSAPFPAQWRRAGSINHVFTHFSLDLDVFRANVASRTTLDGHFWSAAAELNGEALPTVMKKVIEAAIPGATKRAHQGKS